MSTNNEFNMTQVMNNNVPPSVSGNIDFKDLAVIGSNANTNICTSEVTYNADQRMMDYNEMPNDNAQNQVVNAELSSHIADTKKCVLIFLEQPQQLHVFRGVSDSKHGTIKGRDSASSQSDIHPKIQLTVHGETNENVKYLVYVDCYIDDDEKILSPHILIQKDQPKKNLKYAPILEYMKKEEKNTGVYTFELKDYLIISQAAKCLEAVKQKHSKLFADNLIHDEMNRVISKFETFEAFIKELKDLSSEQKLGFKENDLNTLEKSITVIRNIIKSDKKLIPEEKLQNLAEIGKFMSKIKNSNSKVRLGFTIFKKITNNQYEYCTGPLISEPIISDNRKLKILKICNIRGTEGDEVTLVVGGIEKKDVTVFITDREGWEFEISQTNFEKIENTLTFTIPRYEGVKQDEDEVHLYFYLKSKYNIQTPIEGEDEKVRYIYENQIKPKCKKRKMDQPTSSATVQEFKAKTSDGQAVMHDSIAKTTESKSEPRTKEEQVGTKIKDLRILILNSKSKPIEDIYRDEFAYDGENGNSVFHDANLFDRFYFMLKTIIFPHHLTSVIWMQNFDKQTALHLMIAGNHTEEIKMWTSLINFADKDNHFDLSDKFQRLLNEYKEDEILREHLSEAFKRLFGVYDKQGLTVLHAAIINDQRELVEAILKFYKIAKINLNEYEVLGTGDTILHLASSHNLIEMIKLIVEIEPEALYFKNYSGEMATDAYALLFDELNLN